MEAMALGPLHPGQVGPFGWMVNQSKTTGVSEAKAGQG